MRQTDFYRALHRNIEFIQFSKDIAKYANLIKNSFEAKHSAS